MAEQEGSKADRVASLANRLRLLQIDFADQAEDVRRGYLAEEVRRSMASVNPADRPAFLQDIETRFPTWDANVQITVNPGGQRSEFDEKELKDPSFLVGRLLELWGEMPDAQRRAITQRLHDSGVVAAGKPEWPQTNASELKTKLQIGPQEEIVPHRLLEATTMIADLVQSLDHVVWQTWRMIAPQTGVRRPQQLQRTLGRFVAGDQDVPRGQVSQDLNKLRQLIAAMVGVISQTGRFAIQHFKSLSPDEIKVLVGSSGFGLETKYWRKYVELAGTMDAAAVDDAIRQAVAEFIEKLVLGR